VYVCKAVKQFCNLGVTEFLVETQSVKPGDELLITGPTTGAVFITAEDIRVDFNSVEEAVKGDHFSIKTNEKIRPNDQLYKMVTANRRGVAHER
jgi:putative protease